MTLNDFALNPVLDETYATVNNVLKDISSATNMKYFHTGMRVYMYMYMYIQYYTYIYIHTHRR